MTQPNKALQNCSLTSLDQLRAQSAANKKKSEELLATQADNKRQQDFITKAIDVIQKNLAEFEKGGDELARQFEQIGSQLQHKLNCAAERLGDHADTVKEALAKLEEEAKCQQEELLSKEMLLTGEAEQTLLAATRNAARSEKGFEQLRVKDLKERLSQVQALCKEAGSLSGNAPADFAASFALLLLAEERRTTSWLVADHIAEKVDFSFPEDYEKELIAAYEKMFEAREGAVAAQEEFAEAKAAFDQGVKDIAEARASQKDRAVAAARNAAELPTTTKSMAT